MGPRYRDLMENYPDTLAFVQIHHGDGFATSWGNSRATFYSLAYYPTGWFDGVTDVGIVAYSTLEGHYNTRRGVATGVTIHLSGVMTGPQTVEVTATVCIESGSDDLRIYMVEVLNAIWGGLPSYSRNTFRQAASTQNVTVSAGNCQQVVRSFTFDTTSWNNKESIKIIAWAQEPNGSGPAEVHQAAQVSYPFMMDCNENEIADECDIDCGDPNGPCDVPDCGLSDDCNVNGIPDECEDDCNGNGVPDDCDIDPNDPDGNGQVSPDCNVNGTPDECEVGGTEDCQPNGTMDLCDIYAGTSRDCNANDIPDECDIADCDPGDVACQDCNGNGYPDECDLVPQSNVEAQDNCADAEVVCNNITYTGTTSGATNDGSAGCGDSDSTPDVWYYYQPNGYGSAIISLCNSSYDTVLSVYSGCPGTAGNEVDCDDNYCDPQSRVSFSVNPNTDGYWIRISGASGATGDFQMNISGPDCVFDADCNGNQVPDECDLDDCDGSPWCGDCNGTDVLDWCDIDQGTSQDTNSDGIPDECPCDGHGYRGDTNGDGSVNSLDVDPFVAAITDAAQYNIDYAPLTWECTCDTNCDGSINSLDIDPFVECLTGGCPACP